MFSPHLKFLVYSHMTSMSLLTFGLKIMEGTSTNTSKNPPEMHVLIILQYTRIWSWQSLVVQGAAESILG
jgi:hypothetical protein